MFSVEMAGSAELEEDARELFKSLAKGGKVVPIEVFKKSLGEMMGSELPPSERENIDNILSTVACIIDADESGTITEDEFAASANLFVTIANGSSPFDNPDIFFDLLGACSWLRHSHELGREQAYRGT